MFCPSHKNKWSAYHQSRCSSTSISIYCTARFPYTGKRAPIFSPSVFFSHVLFFLLFLSNTGAWKRKNVCVSVCVFSFFFFITCKCVCCIWRNNGQNLVKWFFSSFVVLIWLTFVSISIPSLNTFTQEKQLGLWSSGSILWLRQFFFFSWHITLPKPHIPKHFKNPLEQYTIIF